MTSETVQLTIVGAPGEQIYVVLSSERDPVGATARVAFRGVVGLDGTVEMAVRRSELARAQIVRRPGDALADSRDDEPLRLRTGNLSPDGGRHGDRHLGRDTATIRCTKT